MNDNNRPSGFLDKNTLTAIALSFAVFFLWQLYMGKKYPKSEKPPVAEKIAAAPGAPGTPVAEAVSEKDGAQAPASVTATATTPTTGEFKEETLSFDSPQVSFEVSSDGMGLKNLVLKQYLDRSEKPVHYDQQNRLPLIASAINDGRRFAISKVSEREFVGRLNENGVGAVKTIVVDPDRYVLRTSISVRSAEMKTIRVLNFVQDEVRPVSSSFLLPSYEHQQFFVLNQDDRHRETLDPESTFKSAYEGVRVAAFNSQYFTLALINRADLLPRVQAMTEGNSGGLYFDYQTPQPVDSQTVNFDFYFGPKQNDMLRAVDEELTQVVDYGIFAVIGKPLQWAMKVLYNFVKNWGLAIIILTILLRTVLLPMNVYSFRSMRKMQKIQPKLQLIKEKYKNDPAKINQETLQLMRTEKANPLSGCIPALLQIPIFLALYPMIGNSFELYREPFFLWIDDLTLRDPFYILPILGGLVFFAQQKITPTPNMDPAQQKILMIMPIFLSLFMLSAPSGLALYMLVNSLYGFGQQVVFMKERVGTA